MKPTIKTTTAMGFVVVVFGMLFARYSHLAFPHLPWEIYDGLPALTTVLLPPLWLRMSRRHAIVDPRYAERSILAGFVPLRDGVLAHRQRLPSSLPLTTRSKNGTLYQDLGANRFDKRAQGKHVLRLVKRLKNLGFAVQITPMAA